MKRAWMGMVLLSGAWLAGTAYYHQTDDWSRRACAMMIALGALLMVWRPAKAMDWRASLVGIVLAATAVVASVALVTVPPVEGVVAAPEGMVDSVAAALKPLLTRGPFCMGPILFIAGLACGLVPGLRKWPARVAGGLMLAGAIVATQSVAMAAYESLTARCPNLPGPLVACLAAAARFVGLDATACGPDLALFSMRQVHRLGATWALLLDPASACFLVGGVVLICVRRWRGGASSPGEVLAGVAGLALCFVVWLPLRAILLVGFYMHRVLLTEYDDPYAVMGQFWNAWIHVALLVPPMLMAWRFVGLGPRDDTASAAAEAPDDRSAWMRYRPYLPAVLALAGAAAITAGIFCEPVGERKGGRILIDDARSQLPWPGKSFDTTRTDKPFDTEWYGEGSAYNYASITAYSSHFYTISRRVPPKQIEGRAPVRAERITSEMLRDVDVLFLKVPSGPYLPGEIRAVRKFVQRGGGLLLMGEHTAVFGSGVHLNQIAGEFGFAFRYDCVFGIDEVFKQKYTPPLVPHPMIQHMGPLDLATSCSIDPGLSSGQAVIRGTGVKNLEADFHVSNYYPQPIDRPEMRYGALVQLWATRHGKGRVAAFTDSTIFANFSTFEPGKSELMLGMLEWLNHEEDGWGAMPTVLVVAGVVLLVAAGAVALRGSGPWPLVLAAALAGWAGGTWATQQYHAQAMPRPKPHTAMVRVAIDRTLSKAELPNGGFIAGKDDQFGLFERSVQRVGYFTFRAEADRATEGDMLVVMNPTADPPAGFVDRITAYVKGGGKLLVLDSPENAKSTANALLEPFDLSVSPPADDLFGEVAAPPGWPAVRVEQGVGHRRRLRLAIHRRQHGRHGRHHSRRRPAQDLRLGARAAAIPYQRQVAGDVAARVATRVATCAVVACALLGGTFKRSPNGTEFVGADARGLRMRRLFRQDEHPQAAPRGLRLKVPPVVPHAIELHALRPADCAMHVESPRGGVTI